MHQAARATQQYTVTSSKDNDKDMNCVRSGDTSKRKKENLRALWDHVTLSNGPTENEHYEYAALLRETLDNCLIQGD